MDMFSRGQNIGVSAEELLAMQEDSKGPDRRNSWVAEEPLQDDTAYD